jgi:hypothetical protein
MTDNIAVLDGYTLEAVAESSDGLHDLYLLVKPGTDFDSTFKAWDTDNQEFIRVNGWLYSVSITSVDPDFHAQVKCDACGQMVPRWHVCQYNNAV